MRAIVTLLVLGVAGDSFADHCAVPLARVQRQRVVAAQSYAAPQQKVVVREQVRQYVAPQVDHSYSHSGLSYNYDNHLGLDYGFRVGLDVREDAVAEKVYTKLLRDGTIAAVLAKVHADSLKAAGVEKPLPGGDAPEADKPTADASYQQLLERNSCLKCHKGDKPAGNIDLTGDVSPLVRWKVFNAVFTGAMPQGGKPVGDGDIDLFRQAAAEAE